MSDADTLQTLKLSLQRALVGMVSSNMAAVTGGLNDDTLIVRIYFFGPISDEDRARVSEIGAGVLADFPSRFTIDEICSSLLYERLEMLDFWAFLRSEIDRPGRDF